MSESEIRELMYQAGFTMWRGKTPDSDLFQGGYIDVLNLIKLLQQNIKYPVAKEISVVHIEEGIA